MDRKHALLAILLFGLGSSLTTASEADPDDPTSSSEQSEEGESIEKVEEEDPFFLTDPTMTEREPRPQAKDRIFPLWKKVAGEYALPRPWAISALNFW